MGGINPATEIIIVVQGRSSANGIWSMLNVRGSSNVGLMTRPTLYAHALYEGW